jgi:hypothetical protein
MGLDVGYTLYGQNVLEMYGDHVGDDYWVVVSARQINIAVIIWVQFPKEGFNQGLIMCW